VRALFGKAARTILRSRKKVRFSSLRYWIALVSSKSIFAICTACTKTGKRSKSTTLVDPRLVSHFWFAIRDLRSSSVRVCTTRSPLGSLLIPATQGARKSLLILSRIALLLSPSTFERSVRLENLIFTSRRRWAVGLTSKASPNKGEVKAVVLPKAAMEAQLRAGLLLDREEAVACCFN
jgi:hypothetical protein